MSIRLSLAVLAFATFAFGVRAEPRPAATACGYLASLVPVEGGALFLPSYPTAEDGPLHSVAFLYDNAVAVIALVGCGEPARARRIGDAILTALDHDRAWHDGRLRNAYAAGSLRQLPVNLGGWWDKTQNRWLEDGYQVSSDSGNMAWAILALMALDPAPPGPAYRDGAVRIGTWAAGQADRRGAGGFTGGVSGWEPGPKPIMWKSTEHNTDLVAAFGALFRATGDAVWDRRARAASQFVAAMWNDGCACFAVGTTDDGTTNDGILALDAQIWPLLAVPSMMSTHGAAVLATTDHRLRGGAGYSYSDVSGGGFWTEGTAQVAVAMGLLGRADVVTALNAAVAAQRAPRGGYLATPEPALPTGFTNASDPASQRVYYHLPHLAAAAWAALAERGFNPFLSSKGLP